MRNQKMVAVIIPAFNEEQSIAKVISAIPEWVDDVLVVDNGSTDATIQKAEHAGATVITEPQKGYGAACYRGIEKMQDADIIVFLDADYSDHPEEMHRLVDPIAEGRVQLVIGSRTLGKVERGALTPQQRYGNALACFLIKLFWAKSYTDLGPFRAISSKALRQINMQDRGFGWTVEMQIRAIQEELNVLEVPVPYRKRIGKSKISGTVKGTVMAGTVILKTIFVAALKKKNS